MLLIGAVLLLGAGCGHTPQHAGSLAVAAPLSLARSAAIPGGTWAVLAVGGPARQHDNFWELFTRSAGRAWRLATPPGVASNGGLVIAGLGAGSVVAGFRPSQGLTFSPLAITTNNGVAWSPGVLDAGLADVPGALAAAPADGGLLALGHGFAVASATHGKMWTRLVTLRSLARSAPGRRCGLTALTGVAFSPAGAPLLAGTCRRSGVVGLFALTGRAWRLAGPALPAGPARQPTRVIGLAVTGNRETALLAAGAGRQTQLWGAWSDGHGRWALSRSLPLGGATVRSFSAGPDGSIGAVLDARAGITLAGPGASWQWLPFLPSGTQALAVGPGRVVDALAASGTTFTDWAWTAGSAGWTRTQALHVPVQYGSSG